MPQVVFAEQTGRVLTVRLDNPPRNFLGSRMIAELDALTRRLENDRSIGAVILTGAVPDVFVTHADTPEISRRAEAAGWAPSYRQARTLAAVVGPMGRIPRARRALERTPLAGVLALRRAYEVFAQIKRCVYDGGSRRFSAGLRVEEVSMLATVSSAASLRALAAYHAELGPMDATGDDDVIAAWDRLHDGNLVDMTAP